jgi:hypothetical protein
MYREKFYKILDQRGSSFKSKDKAMTGPNSVKKLMAMTTERTARIKAFQEKERSIEQKVTRSS